ncbi:MAG: four helix bundle protein [Elusimicrobiota bacterium]|jgi:four helix bundle protein
MKAGDLWIVQAAERLMQRISPIVIRWDNYHRRIIGEQLVRASSSVGANLVEGYGRGHRLDSVRFYYIARGSLEETRYWLHQARDQGLLDGRTAAELSGCYQQLEKAINSFIQSHQR